MVIVNKDGIKKETKIRKGVKQGCTLSSLYLLHTFKNPNYKRKDKHRNIYLNINGRKTDMVCFADNFALIADNTRNLEKLLKTMNKTSKEKLNVKINVQKNKNFYLWKSK